MSQFWKWSLLVIACVAVGNLGGSEVRHSLAANESAIEERTEIDAGAVSRRKHRRHRHRKGVRKLEAGIEIEVVQVRAQRDVGQTIG